MEDQVEPADVAVTGAIGVPVQLGEPVVTVELTDDSVMEAHPQIPADPLELFELLVGDLDALPQLAAVVPGEELYGVPGAGQDPGGEHIGVGVGAQPGLGRAGVSIVVLVGSHHSGDVVAPVAAVLSRQTGEQA